jgi:hypothetical protein
MRAKGALEIGEFARHHVTHRGGKPLHQHLEDVKRIRGTLRSSISS